MSKVIRTLGDFIQDKDFDCIEIREFHVISNYMSFIFIGKAASKNGELISLDGDSYSKDIQIFDYWYWENPEKGIKSGLTIRISPEIGGGT